MVFWLHISGHHITHYHHIYVFVCVCVCWCICSMLARFDTHWAALCQLAGSATRIAAIRDALTGYWCNDTAFSCSTQVARRIGFVEHINMCKYDTRTMCAFLDLRSRLVGNVSDFWLLKLPKFYWILCRVLCLERNDISKPFLLQCELYTLVSARRKEHIYSIYI